MVLKKQTVWLLTMLSLIIVLSVYYITTPDQGQNQHLAFIEEEEEDQQYSDVEDEQVQAPMVNIEEGGDMVIEEELTDEGVISNIASDEVFTSIRLDRQISRDRLNEQWTNVVASADVTAEAKSEALENIESLHAMTQKEQTLETLIRSKGFEDALVITEDDQVKIIVRANELSAEEANEINLMARDQLGERTVAVGYQPGQ